jgi:hypothetical protein
MIKWPIVIYCVSFFGSYWAGKYFGFWEGLGYMQKKTIRRTVDDGGHMCNPRLSSVACIEVEGELWVKEYRDGNDIPEGRTYMVYCCPWCGYQTTNSKLRQKCF